jgi:hypothetical protein
LFYGSFEVGKLALNSRPDKREVDAEIVVRQ